MDFTIADSIDAMSPSITLALTARARALKADGVDVCSFTAGEPDFDTPLHIRQAVSDAVMEGGDICHYTAAAGTPELKQAVVDKFARENNLRYELNQVMISCGAKQCVYNALAALVNPGDEVLIPAPYWVSYPEMVKALDGVPVVVDCASNPNFCPTPQQLEAASSEKTVALLLNSPGNPTGGLYEVEQVQAIYDWLASTSIVVLSDEIYEHLVYDGLKHLAPATLSDDAFERTLTINGLSKCFAMTGWRIGYAGGPTKLISAMAKLQSHTTSNLATVCQVAALAALEGGMEDVEKMRKTFNKRRKLMVEGLNAINGIECQEPRGAFYVFPKISGLFGGEIKDSLGLCERLLNDEAVAIVPGAAFGADDYARLSYATSTGVIEKGIERIARFASNLLS